MSRITALTLLFTVTAANAIINPWLLAMAWPVMAVLSLVALLTPDLE